MNKLTERDQLLLAICLAIISLIFCMVFLIAGQGFDNILERLPDILNRQQELR